MVARRDQFGAQLDRVGRTVFAFDPVARAYFAGRGRPQLGRTRRQPSFAFERRQQRDERQRAQFVHRVAEIPPRRVAGEQDALVREIDVKQLGLRAVEHPQQGAAGLELLDQRLRDRR